MVTHAIRQKQRRIVGFLAPSLLKERQFVENYDRWSADLALLRGNARRVIVRNMGNGVDRVDGAVFYPVQDAIADGFAGGRSALLQPSPVRIMDLMGYVSSASLVPPHAEDWHLPIGFARVMCDGRMELTGWLALLVGSSTQCPQLRA